MINFNALYELYDSFNALNDDAIWYASIDASVKSEVIRLNTIDQLYERGIDSNSNLVGGGDYAPLTIQNKIAKGQRYDHFTLKDTGAFYDSWVVIVYRDGFMIDADDHSKYDEPLFDIYGEDVLGLTPENIEALTDVVSRKYIQYIQNAIL